MMFVCVHHFVVVFYDTAFLYFFVEDSLMDKCILTFLVTLQITYIIQFRSYGVSYILIFCVLI